MTAPVRVDQNRGAVSVTVRSHKLDSRFEPRYCPSNYGSWLTRSSAPQDQPRQPPASLACAHNNSSLPEFGQILHMDRQAIASRLKTIFENVMDVDVEITPELSAEDIAEWDSLTHVRLIVTVEREFKVRFAAAEVSALKNAGDLIELIERHLQKA
jgi:acyl carrier protein